MTASYDFDSSGDCFAAVQREFCASRIGKSFFQEMKRLRMGDVAGVLLPWQNRVVIGQLRSSDAQGKPSTVKEKLQDQCRKLLNPSESFDIQLRCPRFRE